jgi:hypothetical protein
VRLRSGGNPLGSTALQVRVPVLVVGAVLCSCQTVSSTRIPLEITRVAVAGVSAPEGFVVGEQTFRASDFVGRRASDEVARTLIDADLGRAARRWSVVRLSDRDVLGDLEIMLGRMDDGADISTRSAGGLPRVFVDRVLNASHPQHAETLSALVFVATRAGVDGVIVLEGQSEPLTTARLELGFFNTCVFTAAMVTKSGQVINLTPLDNRGGGGPAVSVFTGEGSAASNTILAERLDECFKFRVSQWLKELGVMSQSRR